MQPKMQKQKTQNIPLGLLNMRMRKHLTNATNIVKKNEKQQKNSFKMWRFSFLLLFYFIYLFIIIFLLFVA